MRFYDPWLNEVLVFITLASGAGLAFLFLLRAGWRGRAVWSGARCGGRNGKCGYELRGMKNPTQGSCPECGQDLSVPGAVNFVRMKMHWGLFALALVVLLLPVGEYWGVVGYQWYQQKQQLRKNALGTNFQTRWRNLSEKPLEEIAVFVS